jgi:hypothetical protein
VFLVAFAFELIVLDFHISNVNSFGGENVENKSQINPIK